MRTNLLAQQKEIKKSLTRQAARMWGISDLKRMDPLVNLLMESVSYELSKVGQSITASNSKMLEKLSNMMVAGNWGLSQSAHTVIKVSPLSSDIFLSPYNQFYMPNGLIEVTKGKIQGDIYFAPVEKVQLFNGAINWEISRNKVYQLDDEDKMELFRMQHSKQIPDNELWIGIELGDGPQKLSVLDFYIDTLITENVNEVLRCNSLIKLELYKPNEDNVELNFVDAVSSEKNIGFSHREKRDNISRIKEYYNNKFISFSANDEIELNDEWTSTIPDDLKPFFREEHLDLMKTKCIWLKFKFPPIFKRSFLAKTTLQLNCLVVANRKLNKFQHNHERSGTVLPIELQLGEQFSSVEKLTDKYENKYQNLPSVNTTNLNEGSFKVYYGSMDSFDDVRGILALKKIMHKIREEGNSFAALGMDSILNDLKGVYEKLEELDKKILRKKNETNAYETFYILAKPFKSAKWLDYEYWTTNASLANHLPIGTLLQQYRSNNVLDPNNIKLMSRTIGGKDMATEESKVYQFRHELLAKGRIVSKSDLLSFIQKEIGHLIRNIEISDGVAIHPTSPKKGLIRITKINLIPSKESFLSMSEWQVVCNGLEYNIKQKAIMGQNYKLSVRDENKISMQI